MNLDRAQERFEHSPSPTTASEYLITALRYWHDDMISDETFGTEIVQKVAHWLKD